MFPNPLPIPEDILQARHERKALLMRSARRGIALRLSIALIEVLVVFFFGSATLLLDALSSVSDIAASALLIACVAAADRPPDSNHPFGHGRFEPLTGLLMGIVLIILGGVMFIFQAFELMHPPQQEHFQPWLWLVPLAAFFLLESAYWIVIRAAKRMHCPALAVDAIHYRVDAVTSIVAAAVLVSAAYSPEWSFLLDHYGAAVIALFMVVLGFWSAHSNVQQLTDRAPAPEYFARVRGAALAVAGVFETEKLRIQTYGPDAHISIDIEVDPHLSVDEAHQISQKVRLSIQRQWPAVRDVIVHIEPYYPNDH